jgi:hypothetical protein
MAYVSHQNQLVFIHIYKTAGMSVREFIKSIDEESVDICQGHSDILETMIEFENKEELHKCLQYHKFSVVRNPYNWLFSIYNYSKTHKSHPFYSVLENSNFNFFCLWYISKENEFNKDPNLNGKIQRQTDYLYVNGECWVENILHQETLEEDLRKMLNYLHILYNENIQLPKNNVGDYDKEIVFEDYLDRETIDIINEKFHEDFINFNYQKL